MSDANPHGIKPWQKLWYVPRDGRCPAETITVLDVGARYAGLVGFAGTVRLRLSDLDVVARPGGHHFGRCYVDIPSLEAGVEAEAEWTRFAGLLRAVHRPATVTAANIREAARLLGLEDES